MISFSKKKREEAKKLLESLENCTSVVTAGVRVAIRQKELFLFMVHSGAILVSIIHCKIEII